MRQANGSPLPDGVKFFIWPRYVLSVDGIEVTLSRYRAEIVLFLMSKPGKLFSPEEISMAIYWDREDGGASANTIPPQVFYLLQTCRAAGIDLRLKKHGSLHGYAFMGVGLTEQKIRELENQTAAVEHASPTQETATRKAIRVSQRIARGCDADKPPGRPRKPKKELVIVRYPDTGGWTFPAHYERQYHRTIGKDMAAPVKPLAEHSPSALGTCRLGRHR